jgi:AcrR family transcriptional regulator
VKRDSQATSDRILDAAELLFAKRGFYGVSVREITKDAGVDLSLVNYHFGTKHGLFSAVVERRGEILNRERLERLEKVVREAGSNPPQLDAVLDAFLDPVFERASSADPGWRNYFALVAYVNNSPEWGRLLMTRHFDPVVQKFIAAVRATLPDSDPREIFWAYHFLTGSLTHSLARTGRLDALSGGLCRSDDLASVHKRLARYAASGFRGLHAFAAADRTEVLKKRARAAPSSRTRVKRSTNK